MQRIVPATKGLRILVVAACLLVLMITLSAGLWPFTFQMDNEISWKPMADGLYFGDYAMVISGGRFNGIEASQGKGYSIELWMEPGMTWDSNTILTFYEPANADRILISQSGDDLVYARVPEGSRAQLKPRRIYLDHAFRKGAPVLVTLASKNGQLDMYLDGVLKRTAKNLDFTGKDFDGILVLANSPYGNASWMGTFRGLAFYDRALSAEEIRQNYGKWQSDRNQLRVESNLPYSLYLFDEQAGNIVHNFGRGGPDLVIPRHYFIFHQDLLTPFWQEYRPTWDYVKDIAINVFGLVPLGVCFSALFAWVLGRKRIFLYTAILGFCVSLTIEVLQAFMPTRFSGTTDLITNTTGTVLGAWLYLNVYTQDLLRKFGLVREV